MLENCRNINLLYVEDNKTEILLAQLRFTKYFKNAFFAENGIDALEIFQNNKVDLVILDIEMTEMNGIELSKKIREIDYFIPIVVVSSKSTEEYLIEFVNISVQGFLKKPISNECFFKTIHNVVQCNYSSKYEKIKLSEEISYISKECLIVKLKDNIKLTKKEKTLLELLIENKNKLVSYRTIEMHIWENNEEVMTENSLKTLIKNLRNKTSKELIQNISGMGYKLTF